MISDDFDKTKVIEYWLENSDSDFQTMTDLVSTKNYSWALFMGHLVIEKLLKAFYAKVTNDYPPLIHDLRRIGEKAGATFDSEQVQMLDTISQFNIRARYDDYQRQFYKLCTREFTLEWIEKIKICRQWIKEML